MSADPAVDDLVREHAPRVVGVLARRSGNFAAAEDAVQEALVAAHLTWPRDGVPDNPRGWLLTAAARRLVDEQRSAAARRRREHDWAAGQPEGAEVVQHDDTLSVLLMCCHPALSAASAVALTLRAFGGLRTAEIASAYAVPEATMAQRIARAKRTLRDTGVTFTLPSAEELEGRIDRALAVIYLIYNEGYAASSGPDVIRTERSAEAIRLGRLAHQLLPREPEATALLALMLLLEARRPARITASGELVSLAEQDRGLWDRRLVLEGTALLDSTLRSGRPAGAYQLQAAVAAVHDRAPTAADTDWAQVLALYGLLEQVAPSPFVTLARAVATAEAVGPDAAGPVLEEAARGLPASHRVDAVRGHVAALRGDVEGARRHYREAARGTSNLAEQRHLLRLAGGGGHDVRL